MDDARLTAARTAEAATSRARRVGDRLFSAGEFVRWTALGGTLVLPLLGVASARVRMELGGLLSLLAVAALFHVFAYVLNDVVDLPLDRSEPLRARSPLVKGSVQRWQALVVALAQVPLAFAVASALSVGRAALLALGVSFACMAVYDLSGKRCWFPPLTDFIQGIGWAGLVVFGAYAAAGSVGPLTVALAGYVVVFMLMANGIHGSLRDLQNDSAHGVRSTAILLGARSDPRTGISISIPLLAYTFALHVVLIGVFLVPWVRGDLDHDLAASAAMGAGLVTAVGGTIFLAQAIRSVRDEGGFRSAGMLHLVAMLTAPIVVLLPRMNPDLLIILAVTYLVPLAAHEWLPGALRWTWRQVGWVYRLLRVENCSAAAVATLLGAGPGVRAEPLRVAQAMAVVWLIVAASNAFNDLCDVRIDRINKPDRPIPSGRISPRAVSRLVGVLAAAALVMAWALGWRFGLLATALLGLALMYSITLKNTILIGNGAVGLLAGCTVLYGGLVVDLITWTVIFAAFMIFLLVLSREILKTIADRDADAAAGYQTLGTHLDARLGRHAYAVVASGFVATAILPWFIGGASNAYVLVVIATAVVPILGVIVLMYRSISDRSLQTALWVTKGVWFTGLLSMTLIS